MPFHPEVHLFLPEPLKGPAFRSGGPTVPAIDTSGRTAARAGGLSARRNTTRAETTDCLHPASVWALNPRSRLGTVVTGSLYNAHPGHIWNSSHHFSKRTWGHRVAVPLRRLFGATARHREAAYLPIPTASCVVPTLPPPWEFGMIKLVHLTLHAKPISRLELHLLNHQQAGHTRNLVRRLIHDAGRGARPQPDGGLFSMTPGGSGRCSRTTGALGAPASRLAGASSIRTRARADLRRLSKEVTSQAELGNSPRRPPLDGR